MEAFVGLGSVHGFRAVNGDVKRWKCVSQKSASSNVVVAKSAMGTSEAPKISIFDTGMDTTRKISISTVSIDSNLSKATEILANSALLASLNKKGKKSGSMLLSSTSKSTTGKVEDMYYPLSTRNLAPVIEIEKGKGIKVSYERIDASSNGIKASTKDSIAFWKKPVTKEYVPQESFGSYATAKSKGNQVEVLDDTLYRQYYPSRIRNKAPAIQMRRPAFENDMSAYLILEPIRAELDYELAAKLGATAQVDESVSKKVESDDETPKKSKKEKN